MITPPRRGTALVLIAALATAALSTATLLHPSLAGQARAAEDPDLVQVVAPDEPFGTGPANLDDGHVDLGPRFGPDGVWTLMIRDDTVVPSRWRHLDDVVLRVPDTAIRPVPDDPAYAFVGVEPGELVHVMPQIQQSGTVWLGWNTQEPAMMAAVDRGVTLSLVGAQGPGDVTVFLQSGNLTEPQVLWRHGTTERQPIWVDVNTHTHANWVFTRPGVYLLELEAAADLRNGESVRDRQVLRLAVGDDVSTDEAREAVARLRTDAPPAEVPGATADRGTDERTSSSVWPGALAAAAALAAVGAVALGLGRTSARTRDDALRGRS